MPITNKETAKVKLVIYMKNGDTLRWRNFDTKNHLPIERLMNDMQGRLVEQYAGQFNSAIFYDNQTNEELKRI